MNYSLNKKIIRMLTGIIPFKTIRRKTRDNLLTKITYKMKDDNFKIALTKLKSKVNCKEKVRVAFLVIYDSVFPAQPLFKKMLADDFFEPFILVVPDSSRGNENLLFQIEKTYQTLVSQYGESVVKKAYDKNQKTFIDYVDDADIACFANPYDSMVNKIHSIEYYASKKVLPIYISYGAMFDYYSINHIINLKSMNLCWKVFVDTKYNYDEFVKYTHVKGKHAVLSGYCKMDALNNYEPRTLNRKKIILAPHHSVNLPEFPISNFLEYSDLFLELPNKYPNIDFIFRPHPLLFVTLAKNELWGEEKVENYLNQITSFSNVEYQSGGDYFETFVNSSGIIHDCGSFVMEYLYTGHPACYMLKNPQEIVNIFTELGQKCLANYYHAFNKEDIFKFIDDIILSENDRMQKNRVNFAKSELMINYPNVADFILNYLKQELVK